MVDTFLIYINIDDVLTTSAIRGLIAVAPKQSGLLVLRPSRDAWSVLSARIGVSSGGHPK